MAPPTSQNNPESSRGKGKGRAKVKEPTYDELQPWNANGDTAVTSSSDTTSSRSSTGSSCSNPRPSSSAVEPLSEIVAVSLSNEGPPPSTAGSSSLIAAPSSSHSLQGELIDIPPVSGLGPKYTYELWNKYQEILQAAQLSNSENTPTSKSRKAKKKKSQDESDDSDDLKRPSNAFILFRSAYTKVHKVNNVESRGDQLSQVAGFLWGINPSPTVTPLSPEERQFWHDKSRQLRDKFYADHPGHRFSSKPKRDPNVPRRTVREKEVVNQARIEELARLSGRTGDIQVIKAGLRRWERNNPVQVKTKWCPPETPDLYARQASSSAQAGPSDAAGLSRGACSVPAQSRSSVRKRRAESPEFSGRRTRRKVGDSHPDFSNPPSIASTPSSTLPPLAPASDEGSSAMVLRRLHSDLSPLVIPSSQAPSESTLSSGLLYNSPAPAFDFSQGDYPNFSPIDPNPTSASDSPHHSFDSQLQSAPMLPGSQLHSSASANSSFSQVYDSPYTPSPPFGTHSLPTTSTGSSGLATPVDYHGAYPSSLPYDPQFLPPESPYFRAPQLPFIHTLSAAHYAASSPSYVEPSMMSVRSSGQLPLGSPFKPPWSESQDSFESEANVGPPTYAALPSHPPALLYGDVQSTIEPQPDLDQQRYPLVPSTYYDTSIAFPYHESKEADLSVPYLDDSSADDLYQN